MKNLLIFLVFVSCFGPKPKEVALPLFHVSNKDVSLKSSLDYSSIEIDSIAVDYINKEQPDTLKISVPTSRGQVVLDIYKSDIFSTEFESVSSNGVAVYKKNCSFYTGHVSDDNGSFVTINFVNGEISGVISSNKYGELVIGKESEASTTSYLIYDPYSSNDSLVFNCHEIEVKRDIEKAVDVQVKQNISRCVTVDFELTHEVFLKHGSIQKSNDWLVSMFASVAAIYKAEGIDVKLSKIYNWTTPDGYDPDPFKALNQLGDRRKNDAFFTGDLVQLVRGRDGGALSGIAYVDVLCSKDYRFSYSEPMWSYSVYPAYSWSIMVIAHELGHNIGSPHTHNCNWELSPGVFGAIDGCYKNEGTCTGPIPCPRCGTIMSYCHLNRSVGTDMKNGFGPLPGARIRDRVNNRQCTECGSIIDPPIDPPITPSPSIPVTRKKPVLQSSNYSAFIPEDVNDGNENTYNHTNKEQFPWIEIDLGAVYNIEKIRLLPRKDCCRYRMRDVRVFLSNTQGRSYDDVGWIWEINMSGGITDITKDVKGVGRYLRVHVKNFAAGDWAHFAEIEAWGKIGVACRDSVIVTPYTAYRRDTIKICK